MPPPTVSFPFPIFQPPAEPEPPTPIWTGNGKVTTMLDALGVLYPMAPVFESFTWALDPPTESAMCIDGAMAAPTKVKTGPVYFGFNKDYDYESRVVGDALKKDGPVQTVDMTATPTFRGRTYDLGVDSDRKALRAALCLPDNVNVILDKGTVAVAILLFEAETGQRKLDKLVLSGHSGGSSLWGYDRRSVDFVDVRALFRAYPNAAKQLRHLMVSACYAGYEKDVEKWRDVAPNLQSFWGYDGSSPSGFADKDIRAWAAAAGSNKPSAVNRKVAPSATRDQDKNGIPDNSPATWNVKQGYQGSQPPKALTEAERDVADREDSYTPYADGRALLSDAPTDEYLTEYYSNLQTLAHHPDITAARRAEVVDRLNQVLQWRHPGAPPVQ